jgi:hypothetical protein
VAFTTPSLFFNGNAYVVEKFHPPIPRHINRLNGAQWFSETGHVFGGSAFSPAKDDNKSSEAPEEFYNISTETTAKSALQIALCGSVSADISSVAR